MVVRVLLAVALSILGVSSHLWASQPADFIVSEYGKIVLRAPTWLSAAEADEVAKRLDEGFRALTDIVGAEPLSLWGDPLRVECYDPDVGSENHWRKITVDTRHLASDDSQPPTLLPFPLHLVFYHEMAHSFLVFDETTCYHEPNRAFREAMAGVLAVAAVQRLRPDDPAERRRLTDVVSAEIAKQQRVLPDLRSRGVSALSLDWATGSHPQAEEPLTAILSELSERHGWDLWQRFFSLARDSDLPWMTDDQRLKDNDPSSPRITDLSSPEGVRAVSVFVQLLSSAAGADLTPYFSAWGFRIVRQEAQANPPQIRVLRRFDYYEVTPDGDAVAGHAIGGGIFDHKGRPNLKSAICSDPGGTRHEIGLPEDISRTRPLTWFHWRLDPDSADAAGGRYTVEVTNQDGLRAVEYVDVPSSPPVGAPPRILAPENGSTTVRQLPLLRWQPPEPSPDSYRIVIFDCTQPGEEQHVLTVEARAAKFNCDGEATEQPLIPGHRYRLLLTAIRRPVSMRIGGCDHIIISESTHSIEFQVAQQP